MKKHSKIYIAGHQGMVGSAIWRNFEGKGYTNLIGKTQEELDLTDQQTVNYFFRQEKPEYVILAAAKVGGIVANNTYRAQFIYENLMIQNNIIHSAHFTGVKKLLFLGSSCIYPKNAPQPIREEYLLTGPLEETNEPYAIAKIAGIKLCENYFRQYGSNFISVMPTNLYGPNDSFDLETSHVLPALIRKMHLGKCLQKNDWDAIRKDLDKHPIEGVSGKNSKDEILSTLKKQGITLLQQDTKKKQPEACVTLWGTGKVFREFLHVDDLADACIHIMSTIEASRLYSELKQTHINIGTGIDLTIKELAELIKEVVEFKGRIEWDKEKPDGTHKKQLDVNMLKTLGWQPAVELTEGVRRFYEAAFSLQ